MHCRTCNYDLHRAPGDRCPECGRAFDRDDRRTFYRRPRGFLRRRLERFRWWHAWTAAVLYVVFAIWTLLIVSSGLDNAADKPATVAMTTAGTILGPMTGAISRDFQWCCLEFSLRLMPVCLGALALAAAVQILVPTRPRVQQPVEEVLRRRERDQVRQIKEPNRRHIHSIRRDSATQSWRSWAARSPDDFFNGLRGLLRVTAWLAGLLAWFGGGILSFAHALF